MNATPAQLMDAYREALPQLRNAFSYLESKIGPPEPALVSGRVYPRFREKGIKEAVLQKSARYVSGLHAVILLLANRMLQEEGTLKRALDEIMDDVMFLLTPPENEKEQALHNRYLEVFYAEEFEEGVEPINSKKRRKSIQRREIRDYMERRMGSETSARKALDVLHRTYSGYIHGFSPHLMEMWSWQNKRFDIGGIQNADLFGSHVEDAGNYFIRGFILLASFAHVLGEVATKDALKGAADKLAGLLPP